MNAARERIDLAQKILSSRHDPKQHVTATDVHTLKSCVCGDVTAKFVYEMVTAVIRAELDREQRETARAKKGCDGGAAPERIALWQVKPYGCSGNEKPHANRKRIPPRLMYPKRFP